jgi:hypothetical protein
MRQALAARQMTNWNTPDSARIKKIDCNINFINNEVKNLNLPIDKVKNSIYNLP